MKNILLITWIGGGNFGTCLQSYALNAKLKNLGYNVSFVQDIPIKFKSYIRLAFGFGLKVAKKILRKFCKTANTNSLQCAKRRKFQQENYNVLRINTASKLKEVVKNTDCFITGSDQIWNTYVHFNPRFFLDFADGKKRVAYASSIGTDDVKEEYKEAVKQHLLKFDHIGVREEAAVKALCKLTGRNDIVQVLDPTFLLTPMDWREMSKNAEIEIKIPQNYILCYLIGANSWYTKQLDAVKEKTKIQNIVIIPSAENPNFTFENAIVYKDASPIEFIHLLQKATFVCTDSFHASALSINNSKNFVEFMRFKDDDVKSQNSRIYNLLEHYGLTERIYDKCSDSWTEHIEYERVQKILDNDRKRSLDYLVNAIEN